MKRICDFRFAICDLDAEVAQAFSLLYRRFLIGKRRWSLPRSDSDLRRSFPGLAGCKPAIRQIENLRYGSNRESQI